MIKTFLQAAAKIALGTCVAAAPIQAAQIVGEVEVGPGTYQVEILNDDGTITTKTTKAAPHSWIPTPAEMMEELRDRYGMYVMVEDCTGGQAKTNVTNGVALWCTNEGVGALRNLHQQVRFQFGD